MKKWLVLMFAVLLLNVFTEHSYASFNYHFINVKEGVKLRELPQTDANAAVVLFDGARVNVLSEQGEWANISYQKYEGWVKSAYLTAYTYDESDRFGNFLTLLDNNRSEQIIYGLLQDFNKDSKEDLLLVKHVTNDSSSLNFVYTLYDGDSIEYSQEAVGGLYLLDIYGYKELVNYQFFNGGVPIGYMEYNEEFIDVLTPIEKDFTINHYKKIYAIDESGVETYSYTLNDVEVTADIFEAKTANNSYTILYDFALPNGILNENIGFDYDQLYDEVLQLKLANDQLAEKQQNEELSINDYSKDHIVARNEVLELNAPLDQLLDESDTSNIWKYIMLGLIIIAVAIVVTVFMLHNKRLKA